MRTPLAKSVKKLSSRSSARGSVKSASKAKATRLKPATKHSPAGKARAHKATQVKAAKPKQRTPARKVAKRATGALKKAPKSSPPASARAKVAAAAKKGVSSRPRP